MMLDDYRWLVSDAAQAWLAAVRDELAVARATTASLVARLRKDLTAHRAALVIDQVELRVRAREKFALAERMFFTRKGLEQATDEAVAAVKASRFPPGSIADLCCGIGGDAIELARRIPTRSVSEELSAVDLDAATALLAAANLRACGCAAATATAGDAAAFPVADCTAWHIDPDRRPAGRRTSQVDHFAPPLAEIERLLAQNPNAAVKLAPAAVAPLMWAEQAELCWLGSRGECRQQVAWFGGLARHAGRRSATIVDARGGERTIVGWAAETIPVAPRVGRFVYEPHAAVLAAKLTGDVCREHSLAAVSAGVAYLTGDELVDEPALDAFEISEVLPLDQKRLKAYLRERHIGRLEIKKRGVDIDPAKLRSVIASEGDLDATLLICPIGSSVRAIIARRVAFSLSP